MQSSAPASMSARVMPDSLKAARHDGSSEEMDLASGDDGDDQDIIVNDKDMPDAAGKVC